MNVVTERSRKELLVKVTAEADELTPESAEALSKSIRAMLKHYEKLSRVCVLLAVRYGSGTHQTVAHYVSHFTRTVMSKKSTSDPAMTSPKYSRE